MQRRPDAATARAANFDAICRMVRRGAGLAVVPEERPTPSGDPTRRPAADGRLGDPAPVAGGTRMGAAAAAGAAAGGVLRRESGITGDR